MVFQEFLTDVLQSDSSSKFQRKPTIGSTKPLPIELATKMKFSNRFAARFYRHGALQDYNLLILFAIASRLSLPRG